MLQVHINEGSYSIELNDQEIDISNERWNLDLINPGNRVYHLIKDSKSYLIELLDFNLAQKTVQLRIDGVVFDAQIRDRYDLLLEKLGMEQTGELDHREIVAPMPGLILDILVEPGQKVAKGDKLLVLEAMKMENVIKSAGDGVISSINVKQGMNVEKNQVLIQF